MASSRPTINEDIRALLSRKDLAATRHRAALARMLGLVESDVLAVQYLAAAGTLTPTQLGGLLGLTSGGTTAVIQRLDRLGYVGRDRHPSDGRSAVLRLTPEIERAAGAAYAPLVGDIDAATSRLSEDEQRAVVAFLDEVARAAERRASELSYEADERHRALSGAPMPGLWA